MSNAIPPLLTTRDAATGLVNNINYIFNEDGTVNWRKMVKSEFLAVNEDYFRSRNEAVPDSTEGLPDAALIILLSGLIELAKLRGYSLLRSSPAAGANPESVLITCEIHWLPHRETNMQPVVTTGIAMATLKNTEGFTKAYLAEMAENRAFARCIRRFLGINIVSREEIGSDKLEEAPNTNAADPLVLLNNLMIEKNISFETLKENVKKSNFKGTETWQSTSDIPKFKVMALIKKLKSL
jgi:hypothetical protein